MKLIPSFVWWRWLGPFLVEFQIKPKGWSTRFFLLMEDGFIWRLGRIYLGVSMTGMFFWMMRAIHEWWWDTDYIE